MSRPKKNNAEYYTHDADMRNDIKVKALRRRFSHTGYAVWNYLLETLTDNDYFEITWDEINIELLAADYDVSVEELTKIVEYCVKIRLLQLENDVLRSDAHQNRFNELLDNRVKKSEAGKKGMAKRWGQNDNIVIENDNSVITPLQKTITENNKGEESKGKESKGEEKKGIKKDFDFAFCSPDFLPVLQDWLTYKRQRGETYKTQQSLEALYRKMHTLSGGNVEIAQMIVEQSQANNWAGLFDLKGDAANSQNAKLGYDERFENGRRTYGSGKATIPMNAPPRPSDRYAWNSESQNWIML